MLISPLDQGEFPTLLHFSAFHGLLNLTCLLLECPSVEVAIDIENCSDMTPSELAHLNGHLDIAEKIAHFKVTPYNFTEMTIKAKKCTVLLLIQKCHEDSPPPPTYDFVRQQQQQQRHQQEGDRRRGRPSVPTYQVPPPPRPVQGHQQQLRAVKDPFGTMRASSNNNRDDDSLDDVFLPKQHDPFGTLKAMCNKNNMDYKDSPAKINYSKELEITSELLTLLEDFRTKSFTVKEMETLFNTWRKKAALCSVPEKAKVKTSPPRRWTCTYMC